MLLLTRNHFRQGSAEYDIEKEGIELQLISKFHFNVPKSQRAQFLFCAPLIVFIS